MLAGHTAVSAGLSPPHACKQRSWEEQLGGVAVLRNTAGFYAALHVTGIKDDSRGHPEDELRFRYAIQADGSDSFAAFGGI